MFDDGARGGARVEVDGSSPTGSLTFMDVPSSASSRERPRQRNPTAPLASPRAILDYYRDPDQEKADRVMKVMVKMAKLDFAQLAAAYEGKT